MYVALKIAKSDQNIRVVEKRSHQNLQGVPKSLTMVLTQNIQAEVKKMLFIISGKEDFTYPFIADPVPGHPPTSLTGILRSDWSSREMRETLITACRIKVKKVDVYNSFGKVDFLRKLV